jgi:pimeloyl-ACP methyl ester carboxylesterase
LLTIVIHGAFSDGAYLANDHDFMAAIGNTFGETPEPYYWSGLGVTAATFYSGIIQAGNELASYLNSIPDNVPINIVAHSQGGNVVLAALAGLRRNINTLVTLGTPVNWELEVEARRDSTQNFCSVSAAGDLVQVLGASTVQVGGFVYNAYLATHYESLVFWALLDGDLSLAVYYQSQALLHGFWAAAWATTAKIRPGARNVLLGGFAHVALHNAGVWNQITGPCGLLP